MPGLTHLDEKIYKEPLKFDPDRFLPPRSEEDSEAFSFLAWGVGASTARRLSHHRTRTASECEGGEQGSTRAWG